MTPAFRQGFMDKLAAIKSPEDLAAFYKKLKYRVLNKDTNRPYFNTKSETFENWHLLSPEQIKKHKIGICYDTAAMTDKVLKALGVEHSNYFAHSDKADGWENDPTHAFNVYKDKNGDWRWLEGSWGPYKGNNWKERRRKDLVKKIVKALADASGKKQKLHEVAEFPEPGISMKDWEAEMLKNPVKKAEIKTKLLPHQEKAVGRAVNGDIVLAHSLGSGKTLSSIAAIDKIGKPATVLVPASLVENYKKELKKHKKGGPEVTVMSLPTAISRGYKIPEGNTVVLDEAHSLRNQGTKREQYIIDQLENAGRVIALTGTPAYNNPYDIAQLVNIVSRKNVFPRDKGAFESLYFKDKRIPAPVLARLLKGVKPGKKTELDIDAAYALKKKLNEFVDEVDLKQDLPAVSSENVYVNMDDPQLEAYDYVTRNLPSDLLYKLQHNIAPNKTETKKLQAFLSAARQVSNTAGVVDLDVEGSPKLDKAVENLAKFLADNKKARALVYSNYLSAGVEPYAKKLDDLGLKYNMFTGSMSSGQKKKVVDQYNSGEVPIILGTGSASEGLDLKGTRLIQLLEPHWNNARLDQVIGRGVRYKSHDDLPNNERNVKIEKFYSTVPESGRIIKRKRSGVDEYLRDRAAEKQELIDSIKKLLAEPEEKAAESKEVYSSGSGTVESFTPDKTDGHDEIVLRLKNGKKIVISNNTKLGIRVIPDEGDELGYHGYQINGTNVVHKVHSNKHQRGGWLEYPEDIPARM